ncbi:DNA adenine methylase [Meiothermus granaticius]|uniref:site-specific DNA-methyltransferase (adenine-specific) n=1 Tax=Meiothermus granaticius NBRC 107808 TaxID=1227551 RepID=A0A399FEN9_9DEIN|nr:DNA adenine methylase [Meiothermus granaticius]RIH94009.1 Modification methylase DpnIIA [Meiothermus granaticius NBRC 107808]GEM88162.1 DNA methyltransferase [Meiothermus granaticius NBRC 107808]
MTTTLAEEPLSREPARPPLRYFGSKWQIAPFVLQHFPPHESYVEPFGGGASILLRKPRSKLETYNDRDGGVVNFFRVLRERPGELIRALELTPWARAEYERSTEPAEDPLEAARRFFVLSWMGIGMNAVDRQRSFRYVAKASGIWRPPARLWDLSHLWAVAERMLGVQIMQDDAFEMISRFDDPEALIYCDPPYLLETRRKKSASYRHELSEADHLRLAEQLRGLAAHALISGYPSELYADLYEAHGWVRVETQTYTNNSRQSARTEALWLSPRSWRALRGLQPGLFAAGALKE